jgi:DUF4097 and DUF4098 domain-containing protein YvlB
VRLLSEERTLILKMLEQGKITASEAEALLKAIETPAPEQSFATENENTAGNANEVVSDIKQRLQQMKENIDDNYEKVKTKLNSEQLPKEVESLLNNLYTGVSRVISEVPKVFNRIRSIDFGGGWLYSLNKSYSGTISTDRPSPITINAVDGSIYLETVDSPEYKVTACIKTPRFYDSNALPKLVQNHLHWETTDNGFTIQADDRYIVDIKVQIPSNGRYELRLKTEDGSIHCRGEIKGPALWAQTADGNIKLTDVSMDNVVVKTDDGNIRGYNLKVNTLDAKSSDGNLHFQGRINRAVIVTSDGQINVWGQTDEVTAENFWDLVTEDGTIQIHLPCSTQTGYDLDLYSDSRSIKLNLPNMPGQHMQIEDRLTFLSTDYHNKPVKFRVKARAEDGTISVKCQEK